MTEFDYVSSQLEYNPQTGLLKWKVGQKGRRIGQPAGGLDSKGYIRIRLNGIGGHKFLAHRVIWLLVTGQWPVGFLDHKNGDRSDNRLSNLREATRAQNSQNSKINRTNTTGVKGVYFDRGRNRPSPWRAFITIQGEKTFIGYFPSLEEAKSAREKMEEKHFKDFRYESN